jgi:predicted ATPase
MKLAKLKIENFKRIEIIEIPLSDVNILVGTNGSGKSSIIQAVHLACCVMRQADRVDEKSTSTVGVEELDYLPTDDYKTLGHRSNWGNKADSPASVITFTFENMQHECETAYCRLRSARNNAGISISGAISNTTSLSPLIRTKKNFFSAYIPGISGIPNREEKKSKRVILKACSFGDSNIILRNALLLLKENSIENIKTIETWISKIIGPIQIKIEHDPDNDLYLSCDLIQKNITKPIELAGTGYLQLIQIFCYILLFKPGVLLIDEPDIHLHPYVQENLVRVLGEVAKDRDVRIILTTHSPFIVRGAPTNTNICWLNEGALESQNRKLVEYALGWGAFGKKIILISEDSNTQFLKKIISQWPDLDQTISLLPGNGYKEIPTPHKAAKLKETLSQKYKIIIHRDRDSLTDKEVHSISSEYLKNGIHIWFTEESDVEAYFCQPKFLSLLLNISYDEASNTINSLISDNSVPLYDQFKKQRSSHNQELHQDGGGQNNESIWADFQTRPLKGSKGKYLFNQLKNSLGASKFSEEIILNITFSDVALNLQSVIDDALSV